MVEALKLARKPRSSLPDEIVQRVVALILDQGLRPGDRLPSERSARDVVEARRIVEIELAGLAAERATSEELAAIGERLALMQIHIDDPEAFAQHDVEFHLAIARAAHNQVLYHVIDTLRHVLRAWFVEAYHQVGHQLDHEQRRDAGQARGAMARHVEGGARWLRDAMQRTGRRATEAD